MRRRFGVTLVELLVVIAIAGIALSLVAAVSLRQQRTFADLADAAALAGQLHDAAAILPIDLRGASAARGDLRDARDTALELRATIASALVCDTGNRTVILAPPDDGVDAYASFLTPIEVGDTAWVFTAADSGSQWPAYRVARQGPAAPALCAAGGPVLSGAAKKAPRIAIELEAASMTAAPGTPVRFTHRLRYSLYHASDGGWYLGEREWNNTAMRFNTIQPVTGPFLSPVEGGLVFRYFDRTGAELAVPVADTRAIALVRVELRGRTRHGARVVGSAQGPGGVDSLGVAVLLRNSR